MKKILIILPNNKIGGTNSSLMSLLNTSFRSENEVSLLFLNYFSYSRIFDALKSNIIKRNFLMRLLYQDYTQGSPIEKLLMLPLKMIKHIPVIKDLVVNSLNKVIVSSIEKQSNFDCVISFQEGEATNFTRHFRCKNKIAWIHSDYAYNNSFSNAHLNLYNSFNSIVCVSNTTKKSFCSVYPSLEYKVVSIYNILDVKNVIKKSTQEINDANFDCSKFTIISVGRVVPVKHFSIIPMIASVLKQKGMDFKWYIIGDLGLTSEVESIRQEILNNKVSEQVFLLGKKDNPYPYFVESSLLVSTSLSEACPMIFNEAKILGLRIVSTNYLSAYEFIEQGVDGYIGSIQELPSLIYSCYIQKTQTTSSHLNSNLSEKRILADIRKLLN